MPRLVPFRLVAACALALIALLVGATVAAAKGGSEELRVLGGGGKLLAEESLRAGTVKVPTSPKATCLGKGTGGSGKAATVKGANALSLLGKAAKSNAALRPLSITDHFASEFGLGVCGVGGYASHGALSWYLKVNHKNPNLGGEAVKVKPGDEVLWALAKYPYPKELSLVAPEQTTLGVPFTVRVFSYDDKGKRKPAAGATVTGALAPTAADGSATVVLTAPTVLAASHGKDLPSNRVAVCVNGACPQA
ncbi:MAG TPA: hypothetical protein VHQ43_04800 [Solirubrobacterales bacterium]|nr:hypothetical protein [Solirubrobacterales bacterium]